MGQLLIRNLDDDVVAFHKLEAKHQGVSLEQYLRTVLSELAGAAHKARMKRFLETSDRITQNADADRFQELIEIARAEREERDARNLKAASGRL